ncbi:STAS domain-containing protein [Streptomyces sp. NBC_00620]|uniref:STAS domain-containing protein n=1 Tax=Streptomyces sp. NBC_00620 TaxID=2903666 RepID=UPI00225A8E13|nr:STAS domain-containing protein [Streptomyces sp. NBC_00620]MCX4977816.1 STAS domain-containing protein [Streptomyces sp. NBC_00620]
MPLPQLNVYRHDSKKRALITLTGEIDLQSAPLVREALERCLRDGVRTIDVDLTPVTFCDCSGLNTFIKASQRTAEVGGSLQLHYPPYTLALLVELTGTGFLLAGLPPVQGESPLTPAPTATDPAPGLLACSEAHRSELVRPG